MADGKACCFIGHRKISKTDRLIQVLNTHIENLTINGVSLFLFGSRSEFDSLCLGIVSQYKTKYPSIQRVYVRGEYECINEAYERSLLQYYDRSYFPDSVRNAGRLSYIKRNEEMIDKSDVCIFYYDDNYTAGKQNLKRTSGTKTAFLYATKKHKHIINVFTAINPT